MSARAVLGAVAAAIGGAGIAVVVAPNLVEAVEARVRFSMRVAVSSEGA